MLESKNSVRSLVIQGYLNGKPRDQIATDVGISGGRVSGIIKEWITEMGKPNVEPMREFAVILNKSGVSVKQCAEGYRIVQLLKNRGINGETDGYGYNANNDNNGNNEGDPNKEIISFIEETYQSCKKFGISPSIVPAWIRDLLDLFGYRYGYSHNNKNHRNSMASINDGYGQDNHIECGEYGRQQQQQQQRWPDTKPNKQNPPLDDGVPFVSQVSRYIDQKKKENRMLKGDNRT